MLHLISGFKNLKPHKNLGLYFRWKSGSGGSVVQGLMCKTMPLSSCDQPLPYLKIKEVDKGG